MTQLYVSVDASTKESLRRIDRPLFKDFWQRFLDSLKALAEKVPTEEWTFKWLFPSFCTLLTHHTFLLPSHLTCSYFLQKQKA